MSNDSGTARSVQPEVEIIASLVAIFMAATAMLLTLQTGTVLLSTIRISCGMALFLLNTPVIIQRLFPGHRARKAAVVTIGLVVAIYAADKFALSVPFELFSSIGILAFAVIVISSVRAGGVIPFLSAVFWGICFSFVVGQMVWGSGWKNPLDVFQFAQNGSTHTDPAFHNAVVAMLATYGVCTTGLDGLVPFSYHHAAHWLAALVCRTMQTTPYVATTIVLPILLPASLVYWSGLMVREIGRIFQVDSFSLSYCVFLTGLAGYLPTSMLEGGFISWPWTFSMDSQILGLTIAAGAAVLLIDVCSQRSFVETNADVKTWPLRFALISILTTILLMLAKITVSHLFALVVIYAAIRIGASWKRVAILAIGLAIIIRQMSPVLELNSDDFLKISPFGLWVQRVPWSSWPLCVPVNTISGIIYAIIRLHQKQVRTLGDVVRSLRERSLVDVELVLLVAFAGTGLTMVFGGRQAFNSIYYQNTAQFFTFAALAGIIHLYFRDVRGSRWRDLSVGKLMSLTLLAAVFMTAIVNSAEKWIDIVRLNMKSRGDAFATPLGVDSVVGKPEIRRLLRDGEFAKSVELMAKNTTFTKTRIESGDKMIVGRLISLGKTMDRERKRESILWIPRTNRSFWDLAPDGRRWLLPMFAVAMTELALIDGLPEEQELSGGGFGFSVYPNTVTRAEDGLPMEKIMMKATEMGFKSVVELQPDGSTLLHRLDQSSK